jgi:hypothetical protein
MPDSCFRSELVAGCVLATPRQQLASKFPRLAVVDGYMTPPYAPQGAPGKLGKTWAKNRAQIGAKLGFEGCKRRRINNELD